MSLKPTLLAFLLLATPAMAFDTSKLGQMGSLPLSDLAALLKRTPKLKAEVDKMLTERNKKADDLMCDGNRFPGSWVNLGGERVAPYTCDFGGKWLQIKTSVRITDRRGKAYETVTSQAMKNATKATETNVTWKWSDEEPRDR